MVPLADICVLARKFVPLQGPGAYKLPTVRQTLHFLLLLYFLGCKQSCWSHAGSSNRDGGSSEEGKVNQLCAINVKIGYSKLMFPHQS